MKCSRSTPVVKVAPVALGCAKNTVDLQVMVGHLLKAGFAIAPESEADVILVNTCAFIEAAREEAVAEIMQACERKAAGEVAVVAVSGCFTQRYGRRAAELFPDVDCWIGVDELDRAPGLIRDALRGSRRGGCDFALPKRVFSPPAPKLRFTSSEYAWLKIAEGCAHRCAYCAIPAIRGRYRSRALADVVAEARSLLADGVKELNVIAQDPMLYGVDLRGGKRIDIVALLKRLDALKGEFWIRVLYSYPSEITDEFLDWMRTSPHAARYVDVPLQHTDPEVLSRMARASAVKASLAAAERIRSAVPGVTLRTTVMTGFPGETERRFERLLADVRRMRFDHLGAFAFSPEEGTPAAAMRGRPSARIAAQREKEVMSVQRRVWASIARKLVGTEQRALVCAPGIARLESQAPDVDGVTFVPENVPLGFARVRIVAVRKYDFIAEPV